MRLEELRAAAGPDRLLPVSRLAEFGVSPAIRRRWASEGWLFEVRKGIVLVGGGTPSGWQRAVAAMLAAGEGAVLSHWTAARVHHLACADPVGDSEPPDVTVIRPAHPELSGCRVHRVVHLPDDQVVPHRAARLTSPVRTLIDLAGELPPAVLERTVDEGTVAGVWRIGALAAAVEGLSCRAGLGNLRKVLEPRIADPPVDSTLEQRVVRVLRPLGPFETRFQVAVDGRVFILDLAWPPYKVAVECDGWTVRSRSRSKFDHDRRRNNLLASYGWTVVHLTAAMSDDEMREAVFKMLIRSAAG